jgi:hypothetical protein
MISLIQRKNTILSASKKIKFITKLQAKEKTYLFKNMDIDI